MPETDETIGCPGPHCACRGVSLSRFFEDVDDSSHRYLVPLSKRAEWIAWRDLPGDDENGWDAPGWAIRIDGGLLTFTNPKVGE